MPVELQDKTTLSEQESYWRNKLPAQLPTMELPVDYKRSEAGEYEKGIVSLRLGSNLAADIQLYGARHHIELEAVLLSAFAFWAHISVREEEVLIGKALFDKVRSGFDWAPMLFSFREDWTKLGLVQMVQEQVDSDRKHSAAAIAPDAQPGHGNEAFLGYHAAFRMASDNTAPDWEIYSEADILLSAAAEEADVLLEAHYNKKLFAQQSIDRFLQQIVNVAEALISGRLESSIREISMLTEWERGLYSALNATDFPIDNECSIPEKFYKAAERYSGNIAISAADGQLTYRELNEASNRVAHLLINEGMKVGDFAAILMERSMETIISLLGILKAGGVYVPIDPEYPKERCRYLLSDTGASFILTKHAFDHLLDGLLEGEDQARNVLHVDSVDIGLDSGNLETDISASDLAYIIYTSGSTGKPKGTMLKHGSVLNMIAANSDIYGANERDVFTQFISFSFDPSVSETFTALFAGAKLYLLSPGERLSAEEFAEAVKREQATGSTVPNAFFTQLALHLPQDKKEHLSTLRHISVGGEALLPAVVQRWREKFGTGTEIINVYGPTECTVLSTYHKVGERIPVDLSSIPIGRPIHNYEAYIVNPYGQLSPINVPGELCIGGAGLAAGYYNNPEKTAAAFVPHSFSLEAGARMYRTGDTVKLLESGDIQFVGRKDSQIKVRGFRIEIGEIEAVLSRYPAIHEAVILPKKMEDGNNSLSAFFTSVGGVPLEEGGIRDYLGEHLPGYMVPDHFIQMDEMPLSPTGKIDRKQIAAAAEKMMPERPFRAPETDTQRVLAAAWQKTLGLERVGVDDDFFHIGGHSLKVLEILVQVKKHFPFLKIQDFFQYHTIAELDEFISSRQCEAASAEEVKEKSNFSIKKLCEPPALYCPGTIQPLPMNKVLLTGSTGYLGSHVLFDLLKRTRAHVYCLIRGESIEVREAKLQESMNYYFGEEGATLLAGRVSVVAGDLGQPEVGLSKAVQAELTAEIDAIIHCGADVRHFGKADHFNNVNIEGTRFLLQLAKKKQGVHFHHVSTIGIPEVLAAEQWDYYEAEGDFDYSVELDNVYNQSKLQAENVVKNAASEGIPVSIYRVGNLSCHSATGQFQRNIDDNAFYRMIKAMLHLGRTPHANWHIDFTPIDYASRAIVSLAGNAKSSGRIFHIVNPEPLKYERFIQYIQEMGYQIELILKSEYENWLLDGDHPEDSAEYLSLAIAQLEGEGAADSEFIFDSSEAQRLLSGMGVGCASPDRDFIRTLIEHGVKRGYFPSPGK